MASGPPELDQTLDPTRNSTTSSSSLSNVSNDILASTNEYTPGHAGSSPLNHGNHINEAGGSSNPLLETARQRFLPIPVATGGHGNASQTSFILSESGDVLTAGEGDALPNEIATADVSISTDGSYVQTSSALAARELKKCYDKILGVGQGPHGLVRSPYVISSYPDEFGASVFRIEKIDRRSEIALTDPLPSHATGSRRKSRLSVHDFLPTNMFKPIESGSLPRINSSTGVVTGSTPPSHTISTSPHQGRRKLRKTRSNSDLHLRGANSPPHGTSTSENSGHLSPPPRSETFSVEIRDEVTAGADAFSQVLGWASELATEPVLSSRKAKMSVASIAEDTGESSNANGVNVERSTKSRRPSISTSAALNSLSMEINVTPFGDNVRYVAPLRQSAIMLDSQRPQLREMQSFESGLTARIGDDPGAPSTPKSKGKVPEKDDGSNSTPPNVFSQPRFSTAVFDVLQTYRGLPLPSSLLSAPPMGATIKMSSTDSPNPKDDPRFVIWGEVQPVGTPIDDASISQSSHTDLSSAGPSMISGSGKRKRSNARSSDTPKLVVDGEGSPPTVIIAGTIERWIAQLTSELNYDELLNFLLTYRTYVSPVDLCHLLICRFHWALEAPCSKQDDTVRRIVRLRTFIAIRYWLLTFFREDFLPNAELCRLFSSWINTLIRDPALQKLPDALSIVRKLRKVVRECKAAYFRPGRSAGRLSMDLSQEASSGIPAGGGNGVENDDSDVDLDFSLMKSHHYNDALTGGGLMNISLTTGSDSRTQSTKMHRAPEGSAAPPSTNSILLSQPLSKTILGHVKSAKSGTDIVSTQTASTLPAQHSAISRAFVNTIGKLGRWKRVLNARAPVPSPYCGDISAFDLEPNATGDLFIVPGGVEGYLKMLNVSPQILPGLHQQNGAVVSSIDGNPTRPPGLELSIEHPVVSSNQMEVSGPSKHVDDSEDVAPDTEAKISQSSNHARESIASSLLEVEASDDNGQTSSGMAPPPGWSPEIVSLDDYDLSDSDSGSDTPAIVRKLPRRLPNRRDFQFVRRSVASVSSMGIRSQSSLSSSIKSGSASASVRSRGSAESGGRPLVSGHFEQWQIELISDDEDEAGDAEAALRRLEGQIDLDRQREKDIKVGRWLKTASRRVGRNDSVSSTQSRRRFSDQAEEDEDEEQGEEGELAVAQIPRDNEDATISVTLTQTSKRPVGVLSAQDVNLTSGSSNLPLDPASSVLTTSLSPVNGNSQTGVPSERARSGSLESNQASIHSIPESSSSIARRPSLLNKGPRQPAPSAFGSSNIPRPHRSFILMHKSETLAQQFAIIEAELFAKIKFEELISHQWGQALEDVDVRDWVQFVKERARLKNMGKPPSDHITTSKLSAILVLRARFDLLVNFTASEILLAYPNERVLLLEKFIRIAWKAYLHNNFSTLVSLISGLQTRWVNQVMARHWHRVGMWEQRIFEDLKRFASRIEQFKFIRNATTTLIDARPLQSGPQDMNALTLIASSSASRSKASELRNAPSACVPFLGVYLAQLYEYEKLPDFIDPTAPSEPVLIDSDSGTLSSPAHPEVFFNLQPLPQELSLEPLINVQKQRLIAGVIKSFVAGQHLATNVPFEVDQKCYQKCYRLRSLGHEALYGVARSLAEQ